MKNKKYEMVLLDRILSLAALSQKTIAENILKPNILMVITDQQHDGMMSCTGNTLVNTSNFDRLASQGIRVERAYAANRVCVLSRFSLMTGFLPSVIGMEYNDGQRNFVSQKILNSAFGCLFTNAVYETAYAGKMHLTGSNPETGYENPLVYGFSKYITQNDHEGRDETVKARVNFSKLSREYQFRICPGFLRIKTNCR